MGGATKSVATQKANSMSRHLIHDLEEAYNRLLGLSASVEEMIGMSVRSLVERNSDLAERVIARDEHVDQTEVRIEEECLKILAMHQPVAADLRRIATMMKVNNDLERMADLAVNIAERALSIRSEGEFPIPQQLNGMAAMTTLMVRRSLDAFVQQDLELAYQVIAGDDAIDQMNVRVIDELTRLMAQRSDWISTALHCFSVSRHLERIADHAANIASDLVYMVEGIIVRHRRGGPSDALPTQAAG